MVSWNLPSKKKSGKIFSKDHTVKCVITNNQKVFGEYVIGATRPMEKEGVREEALICSIFQFMWFKYFHIGQLSCQYVVTEHEIENKCSQLSLANSNDLVPTQQWKANWGQVL